MAKVFSGVRTNVAAALAAAVGGIALTACNTGGYDTRPAPAYPQPSPTYSQPSYSQPTYPQPAPAPAPAPRPQSGCGARCG